MTDGQNETRSRDDSARDIRVMRVLDDFLRRRAAGDPVSQAALLAAHPDLADELREHLELVGHLQPADRLIDEMVERGVLQRSADPRYRAELGPYQVTQVIGRGGMGVVLEAHDTNLDRRVALKLLRPDLVQDTVALARFEREAKAAAALRHPNIVTIYAVGQEHGVHFLAMEYVDGPSLAAVIRSAHAAAEPRDSSRAEAPPHGMNAAAPTTTCLSADVIRRIFRELLLALDAAHRTGLIHRDVKSANILLDRRSSDVAAGATFSADREAGRYASSLPFVKLADFGLARMRSSQTQVTVDGSVLGTPEYMSPEQARGDADIDHRTDLYSAGVVLYEMLTGQTPFRCDTPTATIRQILDEEPPDPRKLDKSIDPALASLARRLMAKRPEDRFMSAAEVLRALDARTPVRVRRRIRGGHRWMLILSAAVLVVGVAWLARNGAGQARPHARRISKIALSADRKDILAFYDSSSVPERLLWLEQLGYRGQFAPGAIVVARPGGRQVVAIGCLEPLDPNGSTLIAFGPNGRELWRRNLVPPWGWPDAPDARYWRPTAFAVGDLDRAPGDELVVIANHPGEYPTRLSVVDGETGVFRSTVWHFGQLQEGLAIVDGFDDHQPAVVAWGQSNKLDGFEDGLRGPERQFAHWDKVPMVMVLRPGHMDGLAPPPVDPQRLAELGWPPVEPARVWAYAFLDLPVSDQEPYVPNANPRITIPEWQDPMPHAFAVTIRVCTSPALPGARLELWTAIGPAEEARVHSARLELDQNLTLLDIGEPPPDAHGRRGTNKAFWEQYWHVIMRDGEHVDEAASGTP